MPDPSPLPLQRFGIAVHGPGKYRAVTSVAKMAEILLEFWPLSKRGDAWHGAMEACLRALEAQSNPEAAKAAFVMAARDAEMHIDNNAENYAPPPQRLPREKRPGRRRQR